VAVKGEEGAKGPDLPHKGLIGMVQPPRVMASRGVLEEDFRLLRDPNLKDPGLGLGKNRLLFFEIPLGLEGPAGERGQQEKDG
jgi:hypothetical protein